ncbi:F-box only protein 15 [Anabas testudineus]|uniref:F-box domain-containing protein n=1 Tax=Anabas testudineus TaxID=64144 RepID=A0A3Q1II91_ANATE|nr:F-box only protein 15 [Anabas testudineus]XP_026217014.1 F-box only protein 15 [Anabas testudineus]
MAAAKAVISSRRAVRRHLIKAGADTSSPAAPRNWLDRLPSEILIKILSYLDASALFSIIHVNKLFSHLANDNALWNKIYIAKFHKNTKQKSKCLDKLLLQMTTVQVQDQAAGYWKWLYFKTVAACDMNKWKRHLELISRHTGLPSRTERVLRNLCITWELTISDKSGHEETFEPSWSQFFETSVTLCWSGGGSLPSYQQISTLQLHGVRRIALDCPGLKKPGRRSLMEKLDMQILTKAVKVIGQDRLVELKLLQSGIIIGIWKGQSSVAFVMFTLHFHRLVERCTQGSSECPYVEPVVKPPFDDIDPEYGLHGYQLHIVLHNTVCEFMSGSFSQLFCRRSQICDGLMQLTAISRTNLSQHTPLTGSITLPWKCEALQGTVENCCIVTLTLLDEFSKPFWCISSPVSVELHKTPVSYDYDGEHYLVHYHDSDGRVNMEFVRMKERKQFVLVSLVVYVNICKVNKYFDRDY